MSLPQYQEYRDSGIAWLGKVPKHWDVRPFLSVANERTESNTGMKEDNLLSLSYGRIIRKDIESNDGLLPESFETYQIVKHNDIVFRLTDLQNDKRSLRTAIAEEQGIITSAYLAAEPTGIQARFLSYLLRAYDTTKVFYSMGGGLRQSMKFSDIKRLPILVPQLGEQEAIATFLDRETAKIDALIAEQEKLLSLLAEKRQAIISHAVTKGLNPNVPMKDSGVEWLGDVPVHWDATRLGHLTRQIVDGAHFTPTYVDEGVPFLRVTDITSPALDVFDVKRIPEHEHIELCRRCRPEKGDLLLSKNGTIGVPRVVTWDWDFSIFVSLCLIKMGPRLLAEFASFVFQSSAIKIQIEEGSKQSTVTNLHLEKISGFKFPVPPLNEQIEIVTYLSSETARLDELAAEASSAINLLKERRTAAISAAVTGKIDVRHLAN